MSKQVTWFESDEVLLGELRRSRLAGPAAPPPRIPGYDDLKELRRGGQGIVYSAIQLSTRRRVAIKVLLDGALASTEARRRFEREIDMVVGLRHPNIVQVYDSGSTEDGRLYYIMEFIDGAGLDELLSGESRAPSAGRDHETRASGGPVSASDDSPRGGPSAATRFSKAVFGSDRATLLLFSKICDGVQFAHQRGVIHRDLKPSNVRIDADGAPHVLDFGLAKPAAGGADVTQMSQTGSFMGSLPWASPEQAEAQPGRIDVRSDVYSLGVMLYQMLSGQFPYSVNGSLREVLDNIQHAPPRPLREIRRGIDDEIATIVAKCLAKEPERRYQSAGELGRDVRHFLAGEPIEAKRDSAWYAVRKTLDRYKTFVRAATVLLALSIVFSVGMAWLWMRATAAERDAAQRATDLEIAIKAEIEARKATELQVVKTRGVRDFLDTTLRAVEYWKSPGRDLGPLREMLDAAAERLKGAFPDQPDVEAAIAGTLGFDFWTLGLFEKAEPLLRRAYDLNLASLGPEHPNTMATLYDLASMMTERGEHEQSEPLFRQLLEIQCRVLGPDDRRTLSTMNNLAYDIDWQGRVAEAAELYQQAYDGQVATIGPDSIDALHTSNNLAIALRTLGRKEEADRLMRDTIARRSAQLGPHHPETLQAWMNLGRMIADNGDLAGAERLFADTLEQIEAALPANHPLTIACLGNLADTIATLGRTDESIVLLNQALDAQIAFSGESSPLALQRKNQLVCALIEARRFDDALPMGRELKMQLAATVGATDLRTLIAAGNLAYCLKEVGRHQDAEREFQGIVRVATPALGDTAQPVIAAQTNLGGHYADLGRWEEAEAAYRKAIEAMERLHEDSTWKMAVMRAGLGRVLTERGVFEEARRNLELAEPVLTETFGRDHDRTQRCIAYLVRLFERMGDEKSAAAYREKITSANPQPR